VEFGCGPARILPLLSKISGIHLTGVDHDPLFVEYALQVTKERQLKVDVVLGDAMTYQHPKPIDIAVSQRISSSYSQG